MKLRQLVQASLLAIVVTPVFAQNATNEAQAPAQAKPMVQSVKPLSDEQKAQFEQVIRNYLLKNPEVLIEAGEVLQKRQREAMAQRARDAIKTNAVALFKGDSPVVGNPKGDVNVVEFFDYQCIHCKNMSKVMEQLADNDKNVRIIYKEFPIFGESSEFASKAALASEKQGKYHEFHKALLASDSKLSSAKVLTIAKQVGIDTAQLEKDMSSTEINEQLKQNYKLATALGIMGTPAFIVANDPSEQNFKSFFIPGAASLEKLQSKIKEVRQ